MRRLLGGRSHVVKVLLSPDEEARLVPKPATEGLSVQRFLVESAMPEERPFAPRSKRPLPRIVTRPRGGLNGACTNLNQLTHLGNQRREVPTGVEECMVDVEVAMDRLWSSLGSS